jgi:hypothetical protein
VPPIPCSDIYMKPNRWLLIVLALIAGIGLGLTYGWVFDPVDYFDLPPDTLRADFKTDYVLMVAEAYHSNPDPALAARQLGMFGAGSPASIAAQGLDYARANGFDDSDVSLIQDLVTAMQAWSGIR